MWLEVQGKLNIPDELMHKGIQQNMVCSWCNSQGESNSHLFLTCHLPSFLWEEIQQEYMYIVYVCIWVICGQNGGSYIFLSQ